MNRMLLVVAMMVAHSWPADATIMVEELTKDLEIEVLSYPVMP